MGLGDGHDGGVRGHPAAGDGTPGFGDDAMEVVEIAQGALLEVRVEFDLVEHRHDTGGLDDLVDVIGLEVRDADRAQPPAGLQFDEGLPGLDEATVARSRPMDQQEIEFVEPERLHRGVEGLEGLLPSLERVPHLRGDEDVVPGQPRCGDGLTDTLLVHVPPGGVDMPIAGTECLTDHAGGVLGRDLEHPEAQLRDGTAVVERERGSSHGRIVRRSAPHRDPQPDDPPVMHPDPIISGETVAMLIRDEDLSHLSPYLAQHRDNPVEWWSWGPDAFAEAERRDVPVLISVGYSACHWCHVMAHESFEDDDTGALMNRLFVNVKVDREERPDVDAVYMAAVQAMVGRGGWPMTVFALPDGRPFYAGTYFPKVSQGNHISFTTLCTTIDDLWRTRRDDLVAQADEIVEHIASQERIPRSQESPSVSVVDAAVAALLGQVDRVDGGFGRAPKFPQTMSIDTLLRHARRTGDQASLDAALLSLDAMAAGGIYDHLGGGFARYATDQRWLIPHFEKMLYDQALLARVYLHAWQLTGEDRHRQVLDETIEYVLRDLRHPLGGFFSAEDADSEGVEGRFYVWSMDGVRIIAGPDAEDAIAWYGVTESGNWEGTNILERVVRGDLRRPESVERARAALFEAREQRVRPGLDSKVLLEWNGLMLATLAEAAAATGEERWLDAAIETAEFLCANLRRPDGRWLRTWQGPVDGTAADGHAKILAYAADHGAMIDAFVRLAEASGQARWIDEAVATADALVELFWDDENGGVFTTGADAEALVTRPKELMDNATPGANSLAAVGLLRLAALTGIDRHLDRANRIVTMLGEAAGRLPLGFGHLLYAVELQAMGSTEIVITGDRPDLVTAVQRRWTPDAVLAWGEPTSSLLWEGRDDTGADGRAYVCHDRVCGLPADDVAMLLTQLGG